MWVVRVGGGDGNSDHGTTCTCTASIVGGAGARAAWTMQVIVECLCSKFRRLINTCTEMRLDSSHCSCNCPIINSSQVILYYNMIWYLNTTSGSAESHAQVDRNELVGGSTKGGLISKHL